MKAILNLILGLLAIVSIAGISNVHQAENALEPPKIESVATTEEHREEIVTGLCTFGDCPVETTTAPPTTEPTTTQPPATKAATSKHGGYIGKLFITGYTAEEGFPPGSGTASGYGVRSGYCAMNAAQRRSLGIRYGDYIYVEGLGTYRVMDCGCGWGVVDIWVYTNAEAYRLTGYRSVYYA